MAEEIKNSIQELAVSVGKIQLKIKELTEQGKGAKEIFDSVKDSFSGASKMALALAENTKDTFKPGEAKKYIQELNKLNTLFGTLISSQKSVGKAAEKANQKAAESAKARGKAEVDSAKAASDAYEAGFKKLLQGEERIKKLQEDVALKNIQLSKKANIDKLQDVVSYYDKVQSEYKEDSEEYLKIEKKKLNAQINLQKESDALRKNSRKAAVEDALNSQKALEAKQKALRDKIAARNKVRTKEVLDFETKQAKRRADVLAAIERRKEKERTAAVNKGVKDRKAANDKSVKTSQNTVRGGIASQFSPKAIGGAIGSLTKYLGIFQLVNAASRVFKELTIGSAKAAIDFQQSLANLGAVAGATKDEVKLLGREALNVAGATSFTANEIVGLQTELSKLGFSAEDVVESTSSIAFAAQALGSPLGETAALIGKLRNQFNLLVESTGMISDVLVTSINNSALSFEAFGTAIQYVGPIADNLGLTLEQTAGAMAVLADAGFTASRVGTGLRGIFTELGKTSADVEGSLKKLADQQISLAEAVDLVGKRNAAQLITLLKNIDAIDEATGKYYEQGRAFESAAKQVDTFEGQVKLLNSAWNEFQIGLGDFVANSNIVLPILDILSEKAGAVARSYQLINKVGFEKFNESINTVVEGGSAIDEALKLAGISIDEYADARLRLAQATISSVGIPDFNFLLNSERKIVNTVDGVILKLNEQSEAFLKQQAIVDGTAFANGRYEESVDSLISSARQGINVNQEADSTYKKIGLTIERLEKFSETASGNSKVRYDAEIARLVALQGYLTNTILSKEAVARQDKKDAADEEKRQKEALNKDLKRIKESTQTAINAANERAKVETEVAETAEQRADIEAERAKLVSETYKKQAAEIRGLSKEYDTQTESIERTALASDKLSKVLGSEVINDLNKAFSEYGAEVAALQAALNSGAATQEVYDSGISVLRDRLETTIGTFRTLFGTSPELELFFSNLLLNFDAAATKAKEVDEEMEKTFGQALKTELINSLGAALDTAADAISSFNDVALENTKARLDAEKSAIANRYETENDILKSQLDNQLITESQFRAKQIELQKAKVAQENSIEKKLFESEKKRDRQNATTDFAQAIASIIPTLIAYDKTADPISVLAKAAITGALATASYGAELTAIGQKKFVPKKFADGGVVNGPSHGEGGVPFSVQGQGGYEMEGGEYIVNKRSTSMYRGLLEKINRSAKPVNYSSPMRFANGGIVNNVSNVNQQANESVDYLKAIAEATTSTAIGVSKPVRAFVADKDLRTNSNERRLRDRNDRI